MTIPKTAKAKPTATAIPTTLIQRVATTGGRPPSVSACEDGGHTVHREIPYTADYVFWKERA